MRRAWSRSSDLVDGLETLARNAVLGVAEKDGSLDDVEDELFRFGRILDREPELAAAAGRLGDARPTSASALLRPPARRQGHPVTAALLEQAVPATPRGRDLDVVAEELAELAAARRERYVAHVRTPVRLTERAGAAPARHADPALRPADLPAGRARPDLLGGLVVRVGGELIDGSVAGRLRAAAPPATPVTRPTASATPTRRQRREGSGA